MGKSDNRRINEISRETALAAADRQEKLLANSGYLKRISAWQYLKCIKRLDDFRKYADGIVDAINSGNIGTPDDPVLPQSAINTAAADAILRAENDAERELPAGAVAAPVFSEPVPPAAGGPKDRPLYRDVVKKKIPYAGSTKPGKYTVRYKTLSGDDASEWVNAQCINNAINTVLDRTWDVSEIVEVTYDGPEEAEIEMRSADGRKGRKTKVVIERPEKQPLSQLGQEIAAIMTGSAFKSMVDLIADIHDDWTTVSCAEGDDYIGLTVDGVRWEGRKSSYRDVYEKNPKKYADGTEKNVVVIDRIVPDGQDVQVPGVYTASAMKAALRNGIVHFNFTKVSDGEERQAFGTTNEDILAANNAGADKSKSGGKSEKTIRYYDMTKHGWRSFSVQMVNTIYDESFNK